MAKFGQIWSRWSARDGASKQPSKQVSERQSSLRWSCHMSSPSDETVIPKSFHLSPSQDKGREREKERKLQSLDWKRLFLVQLTILRLNRTFDVWTVGQRKSSKSDDQTDLYKVVIIIHLFKIGQSGPLYVYFHSLLATFFTEKTVGFSGILSMIIGVEVEL